MIAVQLMILGNFELTSEKVAMGQKFCCAQTLMLFNITYEVLFAHSKFFETIDLFMFPWVVNKCKNEGSERPPKCQNISLYELEQSLSLSQDEGEQC